LIEIGSKTAEKNSAQTDRQTDTTKIMVTWPWTNTRDVQNIQFWQFVVCSEDCQALYTIIHI